MSHRIGAPLSDAERAQRQAAGRASYRQMVRRSLAQATNEAGVVDLDRAAQILTGARLARGMNARLHRGIRARHMFDWCLKLNIQVLDHGKYVLLAVTAPEAYEGGD